MNLAFTAILSIPNHDEANNEMEQLQPQSSKPALINQVKK